MGQRLLTVDVFTPAHRLHRDRPVHVIRRRNIDRVDVVVFAIEQLSPVLVNPQIWIFFHQLGHPALEVNFGNCDKFHLR